MILAHRIALEPTPEQAQAFARAAGAARFAWNWAFARWKAQVHAGGKPSESALRRELNAIKGEQFPWLAQVTKNAPQQAIKNLGRAFRNFFEGRARYPRFKKKGKSRDSFRADNGTDRTHPHAVRVEGRRVQLPRIGWVRMREALRFQGQVQRATVSRVADRWYVSLAVEFEHTAPVRETQAVVGVDLGVKALATCSDGRVIPGPEALGCSLTRLRRLSRALQRKRKGSANRRKARGRLARLHARIAAQRSDALHKLTTDLVRRFDRIGIEALNVRGMMANRSLARALSDGGWFEFGRQLAYKAHLHGATVVQADRWFPSSKRCSACTAVYAELSLAEREWRCQSCGVVHDRDRNAALNLMQLAASSAVNACGAEGSGSERPVRVKPAARKQEPAHELSAQG